MEIQIKKLLDVYGKAWVDRDSDLITTIFTEDATYDDPHEPINIGKQAIKKYWQEKVVKGQSDIKFNLQNIWIDKETVIAEWQAEFTDVVRQIRIKMKEVGIFTYRNGKFSSLREYYDAKKFPI